MTFSRNDQKRKQLIGHQLLVVATNWNFHIQLMEIFSQKFISLVEMLVQKSSRKYKCEVIYDGSIQKV